MCVRCQSVPIYLKWKILYLVLMYTVTCALRRVIARLARLSERCDAATRMTRLHTNLQLVKIWIYSFSIEHSPRWRIASIWQFDVHKLAIPSEIVKVQQFEITYFISRQKKQMYLPYASMVHIWMRIAISCSRRFPSRKIPAYT